MTNVMETFRQISQDWSLYESNMLDVKIFQ